MKLSKFIQGLAVITALSLSYTHVQMQIFELAYHAKGQEKTITRLAEDNSQISYEILKYKSSNHLGGTLLSKDSGLRFREQGTVVRLATSEPAGQEMLSSLPVRKVNPLFSLLTLRPGTEAQAGERTTAPKPW